MPEPGRSRKAGQALYESWVAERLSTGAACRVEHGMTCIPLRADTICRSCFELDVQGQGKPQKPVRAR